MEKIDSQFQVIFTIPYIRKPSSVYYHKNEDLSTARIGGFLFNFFVYTVYQDSGFRGQGPESGTRSKELEVRS